MSLIGTIIRKTGIYDRMQSHFYESMLTPFATRGQISLAERRGLGEVTRNLTSDGPIIEIGTLFGKSTNVILENKKDDQKVVTVDRFSWNPCGFSKQQHRAITSEILSETDAEYLEVIESDKDEFFRKYDGPAPAMVFIDADHSYEGTKNDILAALRLDTAVICGHDYSDDMPGVRQAVDECGGASQLWESFWVLAKKTA